MKHRNLHQEEQHMIAGSRRPWITGGLMVGALGALLSTPPTVGATKVVVKAVLSATAASPAGAEGVAVLILGRGSKAKLIVRARGLEANHDYDVVVDGAVVGSFKTGSLGGGRAIFCTFGKAKHKLRKHIRELTFDPRGATIVVRDAETAADVLVGELGGDGSANGAFACCTPDDGGVECEVRTPEDCTAGGGTPSSATSCFLDPCAVPPVDTVCCVPPSSVDGAFPGDDDDHECDHGRSVCVAGPTPEACLAEGGRVVTASSCDPNPCVRGDDDSSHDDSSDVGSHDDGDHNDDDQGGDGDQGSHDGGGGHGHHGGGDD
jgi:hypothetical protein